MRVVFSLCWAFVSGTTRDRMPILAFYRTPQLSYDGTSVQVRFKENASHQSTDHAQRSVVWSVHARLLFRTETTTRFNHSGLTASFSLREARRPLPSFFRVCKKCIHHHHTRPLHGITRHWDQCMQHQLLLLLMLSCIHYLHVHHLLCAHTTTTPGSN
jgi:hypothetical protein